MSLWIVHFLPGLPRERSVCSMWGRTAFLRRAGRFHCVGGLRLASGIRRLSPAGGTLRISCRNRLRNHSGSSTIRGKTNARSVRGLTRKFLTMFLAADRLNQWSQSFVAGEFSARHRSRRRTGIRSPVQATGESLPWQVDPSRKRVSLSPSVSPLCRSLTKSPRSAATKNCCPETMWMLFTFRCRQAFARNG